MKVRLSADLLTGLLFVALGRFAIAYGSLYAPATAACRGPGYFPMPNRAGLTLVGIVVVVRSLLATGEELGAIGWRPLVLVLAGVLAFGLLIDRLGLLPAGIALIVAARIADREFRWLETLLLAAGLTLAAAAGFLYGLGLPIKLLRL